MSLKLAARHRALETQQQPQWLMLLLTVSEMQLHIMPMVLLVPDCPEQSVSRI
jgi:hypothetical protein